MTGVNIRGRELKITLYADDVLLTLTNPHIFLPNLHAQLDVYGALSEQKLNLTKSNSPDKLHCKSGPDTPTILPVHVANNSLDLLGDQTNVKVLKSLYHANFVPLFQELHTLLTGTPLNDLPNSLISGTPELHLYQLQEKCL